MQNKAARGTYIVKHEVSYILTHNMVPQTSNLSSSVMVLKFFSLRKSHSFTTESSAEVAK